MNRMLVVCAASRPRRFPSRRSLSTLGGCAITSSTLAHVPTTAASAIATAPPPHHSLERLTSTWQHIPSATLTTFSSRCYSSSATSLSPPKKKLGFIAKIQRVLRTIFGSNDDTPRGIQERRDMYWVLLAVSHRKIRMENQMKKLIADSGDDKIKTSSHNAPLVWKGESNDEIQDMMDEAASYLDDKTDINELKLRRLRGEVQTYLEPQITQLLSVAHDVEEAMVSSHGVADNDEETYEFSEEERQMYRDILLSEYENLCELIQDGNGAPYYEIKKGAIETVMSYFDWWPEEGTNIRSKSADADGEDYVDEFGFAPNAADDEILPAMRYYHVRNLVRSSLVRRAPGDIAGDDNNRQPMFYHSILPFKSSIPSAGRGVYVDGFAAAGTLLAFFPGKVWPKEQLQTASLSTQMQFSENDPRHQLSMRYDDILIDSRRSPYTVVKNLWALGHVVNHPPIPAKDDETVNDDTPNPQRRRGPNCVLVPINFTDRMLAGGEDKVRDYIPNEYELPPKPWAKNAFEKDEVIMHGLGLVALRDVRDEELFYDYRLSPDEDGKEGSHYPSWYHVVDLEAIQNRWNMDD